MKSQSIAVVIAAAGGLCMALVGLNICQGLFNGLLQVVGMGVIVFLLDRQPKRLFLLIWVFTAIWLSVSVWWLYIALHDVGGMPWLIAVIAIALLCGGLSLYYAVALSLYVYCKDRLNLVFRLVLFAACWTSAELARAQWFTGFPWGAIGYSHVNGLLSYAAPWVGVYGVGFITALCACWLGWMFTQTKLGIKDGLRISGVIFILALPSCRSNELKGELLTVNLLQGNISQISKYNSGRQQSLDWYAEQALVSLAELTVMPEIAIPYFKEELPKGYWEKLQDKFSTTEQTLLVGMPTLDKDKGYGNSVVGLGFGVEQQYDKYHLVPFGEFTPESLKWFTRLMVNELGDFNRGSLTQAPFIWKNHKFSLTICYEDLFGEELAARFIQADKAPSLFVNVSNIAWFGDTMVVNQHLDIARMRSLEFERPTVRATNTGGTAVISAQGVILKQLPTFTQGNLAFAVNIKEDSEITPFAYWAGRWGLMPLWLLCLTIMGLSVFIASKFVKQKSGL